MKWRDLKVLILEDDPNFIEFLADLISQSRTGIHQIRHATTVRQALELLDQHRFDVALIDLHLPDSAGLDTVLKLRTHAPALPLVVLTAQQDEDYEERALEAGAQEFLLKEEALPRLITRAMRYAIERMKAEIELRESEQRQKVLLESAQVGFLVVEPQSHTIVDANPAALEMLQRSKDEVIGRECHCHVCPAEKGNCPITDLGQTMDRSERELLTADGSFLPILKSVNQIEIGGRTHLLETFVDFSELKEAKGFLEASKENLQMEVNRRTSQLEEAKNQWESTFDAVPDLIAIIDRNHRIVRANRAMARRLNLKPREIVGRFCHELMHDKNAPLPECPHTMLLNDGREHIVHLNEPTLRSDFLVSTSPLLDSRGEIYASVHVARDVSDIKQAQRAVREQLEFLNTIIETIPNPIFIKNSEGVYTGCNSAFADFLGKSREEIVGRTVYEIAPSENAEIYHQQDLALMEKPGTQIYETKVVGANEKIRDVIFYKATYQRESPKGSGLVGVILDITERKQMEEQLVRAQKLEAIGLLAAGIAHEINTPIQFIHTNVEYLEEAFGYCVELADTLSRIVSGLKADQNNDELLKLADQTLTSEELERNREDIADALQGSMEGVERITKIVESMRYFSHPGIEEKEFIDINSAIEHAITVSRNEWKYYAELSTKLDGSLPPVLGYAAPLNQVLLNIIINAAQAISEMLGESPEEKGRISIATGHKNGMVEISISDDGPGITEEVLPNIFNPFFTTKEIGKGTGQGLALAHTVVVDKHQGKIDVASTVGMGTTFIIQLPAEQ